MEVTVQYWLAIYIKKFSLILKLLISNNKSQIIIIPSVSKTSQCKHLSETLATIIA